MKKVMDLKGNPLLLFVNPLEYRHDTGQKRRTETVRVQQKLGKSPLFQDRFLL